MNFSGFNRLATEISSSISSQWIPIPPINYHSLLCFSVVLKSRGNHTSGTDTVRPSSSTTVKASLEHETSTASFHEGHHHQAPRNDPAAIEAGGSSDGTQRR